MFVINLTPSGSEKKRTNHGLLVEFLNPDQFHVTQSIVQHFYVELIRQVAEDR